MSERTERKEWAEILPRYPLMGIPALAAYFGCHQDTASGMLDENVVPSVRIGKRRFVDPEDVAVYVLSQREGITAREFWERHGEATADHVRRYIGRIRKYLAA